MTDKKAEILKLLEQGKITADEALALLNQQPSSSSTPPPFQSPPANNQHYHEPDHSEVEPGWVENLFGWVGDVVNDVAEEIRDWDVSLDLADIFVGSNKRREVFTSNFVSQGIAAITIVGKNARVEVQGYGGDCIRVECTYNARRPETEVYLHEENGRIELVYDEKQMRSMGVFCQVPHTMINEMRIANKNDKIIIEDITAGNVQLYNKNDTIKANNINCTSFMAANRNAAIKTNTLSAQNIAMETTNDNIALENVRANTAALKTTNSRIHVEYVDIAHLKLSTTNAGLKFKNNFFAADSWTGERIIEASTTNSGVSIIVPVDAALKLDASTRGGSISCQREDVFFSESTRHHLQGKSSDYDFASKKLVLNLRTTNASVKVKDM